MVNDNETPNLPAQIADAVTSIPRALIPSAVRALDRLVGAAVDIPVAWFEQQSAKINAKTESYKLVEASIAAAVASGAGTDPDMVQRAMNTLVRKEYRKQLNREAVAAAMVEDLRDSAGSSSDTVSTPPASLDEDWLNVFERFAEDASSDRLQGLWGRVLAGEVRKPGKFSTRTLRFLSEFSQADALIFEEFTKDVFGPAAPKALVIPAERKDIRPLMDLEASGLIQGASGLGLQRTINLDQNGNGFVVEGDLCLVFRGEPNSYITQEIIPLTALGQELLALVVSRKPFDCAKAVAFALRVPEIYECYIGVRVAEGSSDQYNLKHVLWLQESDQTRIFEGDVNPTPE